MCGTLLDHESVDTWPDGPLVIFLGISGAIRSHPKPSIFFGRLMIISELSAIIDDYINHIWDYPINFGRLIISYLMIIWAIPEWLDDEIDSRSTEIWHGTTGKYCWTWTVILHGLYYRSTYQSWILCQFFFFFVVYFHVFSGKLVIVDISNIIVYSLYFGWVSQNMVTGPNHWWFPVVTRAGSLGTKWSSTGFRSWMPRTYPPCTWKNDETWG